MSKRRGVNAKKKANHVKLTQYQTSLEAITLCSYISIQHECQGNTESPSIGIFHHLSTANREVAKTFAIGCSSEKKG